MIAMASSANMYMAMVNANCQLWTNSPEREIKLTPFLCSPNIGGRKSASAILNRVINQEQQATKHKLRDVQIWNIYGHISAWIVAEDMGLLRIGYGLWSDDQLDDGKAN